MSRTEVTGLQIKDQSVDLTVDVTGILPVANGGSGSNTLALGSVLIGNGTGALQAVAPGTSGNVLTSNGSSWVSSAAAGATTGVFADTNFTLQDDGDTTKQVRFQVSGVTTGTTRTLTVPDADLTLVGTDTTQTLSGKTLSAPALTGATKGATGASVEWYNTADQTTNYERVRAYWTGNTFQIIGGQGGTGSARVIQLVSSSGTGTVLSLNTGSASGAVSFTSYSSGVGGSQIASGGQLAQASGNGAGLVLNPTINQAGTAGYTALLINPTETATGSGTKRLIDAQVGGTSKFTVDNSGVVNAVGGVQVNGVPVVTTTGSQSLSNKTLSSATLTTPKIDSVIDSNGNKIVDFVAVANAGNYLKINNDVGGWGPQLAAVGSSTNIDIYLTPKGTGQARIWTGSSTTGTYGVNGTGSNVSLNLVPKGTGTVQANGVPILTRSITTVTSTTTLSANANTDYVVLLGSGAAVTLPTAVGNTSRYTLKNTTGSNMIVSTTSSQTVDGGSLTIGPYASVDLASDNSNWWVI